MDENQGFIFEIWPYVEKIGIPILVVLIAVTVLSVNFYWWSVSELRRFEKHIKWKNSDSGFKSRFVPIVGIFDVIAGFFPLSKFDKDLWNYSYAREQLETITNLRKFYRIVFPIIIVMGTAGIMINEMIIDK